MEHLFPINAITPDTVDWTCKVQVVDIIRPKITKDHHYRFQTIIVQDESEEQICVILYGSNIESYADMFKVFETYFISTAQVRNLQHFSIPLNTFEWVVDAYTIVEDTATEEKLPRPTRLNTISFFDVDNQSMGAEFDMIGVVVNCAAMKYMKEDRIRQELIVIDENKKPIFFTIWGEFVDQEGAKLFKKIHEEGLYPVILAKRITVVDYKGRRFQTRYNSSILIEPPYPQAEALQIWVENNKEALIEYKLKSSSDSPTELTLTAFQEEILHISDVPSVPLDRTFYVEGKLSLPNRFQHFFILMCPCCKHVVRTKERREIKCIKCNERNMLTPKCQLQIDIVDGTGTWPTIISNHLGETFLSTTAEEIFEIIKAKNHHLIVQHVKERIENKMFKICAYKSLTRIPDVEAGALTVLSYVEKGRFGNVTTIEEGCSSSTTDETPRKKQTLEPTTPAKNH